jgi:hypothetical protein
MSLWQSSKAVPIYTGYVSKISSPPSSFTAKPVPYRGWTPIQPVQAPITDLTFGMQPWDVGLQMPANPMNAGLQGLSGCGCSPVTGCQCTPEGLGFDWSQMGLPGQSRLQGLGFDWSWLNQIGQSASDWFRGWTQSQLPPSQQRPSWTYPYPQGTGSLPGLPGLGQLTPYLPYAIAGLLLYRLLKK